MSSRSLVVVMLAAAGAGAIVWMGDARAQQSSSTPAAPQAQPRTQPGTPPGAQPGVEPARPGTVGVPVDPLDALRDRGRTLRDAGRTEPTLPGSDVERGDLEEGTSQNLETDPLEALRNRGTVLDRDALRDGRGEMVRDELGRDELGRDELRRDELRRDPDDSFLLGPGGFGTTFGFGFGGGGMAGAGVGGGGGDMGGLRVVPVTPSDLAGTPERYLGRAVVVRGDVDNVEGSNLFTLDEDSVLIVNATPGFGLRGDEEVIVTGVVRRLVDDDMRGDEEIFGLSAPAVRSLEGRAVIVAQSVQLVPGS